MVLYERRKIEQSKCKVRKWQRQMQHSSMWQYFVCTVKFLSEIGGESLFKSTFCICYSAIAAGILS
jgi:hypothetical protein